MQCHMEHGLQKVTATQVFCNITHKSPTLGYLESNLFKIVTSSVFVYLETSSKIKTVFLELAHSCPQLKICSVLGLI
jgi:hypothetical protein